MHRLSTSRRRDFFCVVFLATGILTFPIAVAGAASLWQGALPCDTVWGPSQSPCTITSELTVPAGVTLTVLPATTVLFPTGARMVIEGRLVAEGSADEPIRFTRAGNSGGWFGLQFRGTTQDNRIRHALLEYARTDDGMIGLEKSRLLLEHVEFDHCDRRRIRTLDSSLIVRQCRFRAIFGPDETPTTDNMSEHLWGSGIPDGGWMILEENVFEPSKGHNDAIDFDGPARPHPVSQIRNNTFLGGGDDALDLECDAIIERNVFTNFVRDRYNKASGEANVISAGGGMHYLLRNNVFVNAQHVVQVKDDSFLTFMNNTVVDIQGAVIYFDLDLPFRGPGRGALVENSIFWRTGAAFQGVAEQTDLTVNYSCLPASWHGYGTGNIHADPLFVGDGDYHLKSQASRWDSGRRAWVHDDVTSPCIDAGDPNTDWTAELWPHGGRINMGAYGGTPQAEMSLSVAGNRADFDHSLAVDARDLSRLVGNWLATVSPVVEDVDRNGIVNFRDLAALARDWRIDLESVVEPLEIDLGRRARWSPDHLGYDPNLPGYHIVGDIASAAIRVRTDDPPDELILAIETSPGGIPMLEGFTFTAPCFTVSGEPFREDGLTAHSRTNSTLPWQVRPEIELDAYFRFGVVGNEVYITFLPRAIELLKVTCTLSWIDWYR